ncbi:MAG: hypothetical protein ACOZB3_08020 [Calditrichota bacterium]
MRHRHVRKLREFYRLNKNLFVNEIHYFFLARQPIINWPEFENRLRQLLSNIPPRSRLDSNQTD